MGCGAKDVHKDGRMMNLPCHAGPAAERLVGSACSYYTDS